MCSGSHRRTMILDSSKAYLDVKSVSIMGKAGILEGGKGDIMIPSAHVFEGTADNYPFKNELKKKDLAGNGIDVYDGSMITVLGTSLQNRDILKFFHDSTWNVIGLEMEGAHYQKAIQSASKLRGSISAKVKVRYAYYASDNPLETGSTLASGGLGTTGVKPTYLITEKIIEQIIENFRFKIPKNLPPISSIISGFFSYDVIRYIESNNFESFIRIKPYLTHRESVREMVKSEFLLLVIPNMEKNMGVITGKIFEYIRSGSKKTPRQISEKRLKMVTQMVSIRIGWSRFTPIIGS